MSIEHYRIQFYVIEKLDSLSYIRSIKYITSINN